MTGRLHKTLVDYVVIAIIPALIMVLVGSLVFFLITAFYHGQYQARLQFIFAMFVLAAVLIARISMEQGTEYASLFAVPLALVTALAMWRFVEIQGPLASLGWLVNLAIMALIWWSAHKLTWDCTLIEEHEDSAGEGLLQLVGLDTRGDAEEQAEVARARRSQAEAPSGERSTTWWQRFRQRRGQPHAPGRWVLYFSLAALPLFGLGQALIPADDAESRGWAFQMLFLYVASGLGLLLTTSFLGLRRYLRQRRLEMPNEMTAVWLGSGAVLILALLIVCSLLPRPTAGFRLTQLPIRFEAPEDIQPNRVGFGNDGPLDPQQATRYRNQPKDQQAGGTSTGGQSGSQGGEPQESGSQQSGSQQSGSQQRGSQQSGSQQSGSQQSGSQQSGSQQSGSQQSGSQQSGSQQSGSQQSGSQQSGSQQSGSQQSGSQQSGSQQSGSQQSGSQQSGSQQSGSQQSGAQRDSQAIRSDQPASRQESAPSDPTRSSDGTSPDEQGAENRGSDGSRSSTAPSRRSFVPRVRTAGVGPTLLWLVKVIFYLGLATVAAFLAWRYRHELREAVQRFWERLREFWRRLFGGRGEGTAGESAPMSSDPPPRPFSDFTDPFATGQSERMTAAELVRYSFEALEAWARERGCPREARQTAHEFARQVAAATPPLARSALGLADLYARLAYARPTAGTASTQPLRELWRQLAAPGVGGQGSGDRERSP